MKKSVVAVDMVEPLGRCRALLSIGGACEMPTENKAKDLAVHIRAMGVDAKVEAVNVDTDSKRRKYFFLNKETAIIHKPKGVVKY